MFCHFLSRCTHTRVCAHACTYTVWDAETHPCLNPCILLITFHSPRRINDDYLQVHLCALMLYILTNITLWWMTSVPMYAHYVIIIYLKSFFATTRAVKIVCPFGGTEEKKDPKWDNFLFYICEHFSSGGRLHQHRRQTCNRSACIDCFSKTARNAQSHSSKTNFQCMFWLMLHVLFWEYTARSPSLNHMDSEDTFKAWLKFQAEQFDMTQSST